ncbi:hypothetical protein [Alteromonas sp. D210916BOD_24]|uniref:hypothetical protein n=1 Tax=Alteromonas sp. D210916BOD_24 TaxID=3157618 RepID=UPI00399D2CF8
MILQIEYPEHLVDLFQWKEARDNIKIKREVRVNAMVSPKGHGDVCFALSNISLT